MSQHLGFLQYKMSYFILEIKLAKSQTDNVYFNHFSGSSSDENAVESSLTFPESSSSEITASMPAPGPSFLTTDNCLSSSGNVGGGWVWQR